MQNRSPIFLYVVLIMQQNIMEKELNSCGGVLLRVDSTGHGQFSQSANFCQKVWDGRALLGQTSKGHLCRISFFSIMFYYIFSISKIGDLFGSLIFLDFRTVCLIHTCHTYIFSVQRYVFGR